MIVLIGNYGSTNIGDEAILHGAIKRLYAENQDEKIIVFSCNPKYTKHSLIKTKYKDIEIICTIPTGIRSFLKSLFTGNIFNNILYIKRANKVIFGGGGLLQDDDIKAIWIWFLKFLFCRVLNKNIEWRSISIGPIHYKISKKIISIIIKYSSYISVRDLNFKFDNKLLPFEQDYVLDLDLISDYNIVYKKYNDHNIVIGISLRNHKYLTPDFICKITRCLNTIQKNYNISFMTLPFEIYNNDDRKILYKLQLPKITYVDNLYVYDMIKKMLQCDIIIGMRLHSIIFAQKLNIPYIPLIYANKINNFVSDIDNKYLKITDFNYEYFTNKLHWILSNLNK